MLHRACALFLLLFLSNGSTFAQDTALWGPHQFQRTSSQPAIFVETIQCAPGVALLTVQNGAANGDDRISSATVTLNGEDIFSPKDFSQNVSGINATVTLLAANTLEVEVKSGPEGFLTLALVREIMGPSLTITAAPKTLCPGESTTLSWQADNVSTCRLEPVGETVPTEGTSTVHPSVTTTYILTGTGPEGTAEANVTVTILPETAATLTAFPTVVGMGETTTLSWACTNADTCSIMPDIGTVQPTGSLDVSPLETTTFTLTAEGPCTTVTAEQLVTIGPSLSVVIESPTDGASVDRPNVFVTGRVTGSRSDEMAVVVNGVLGMIDGDRFYANHVPYDPANATITARATDGDGLTGVDQIMITPGQDCETYIKVVAFEERGIAPLNTTLRASGTFGIDDLTLTQNGPALLSLAPQTEPHSYSLNATAEGVYLFSVNATDRDGNSFSDTCAAQVMNKAALDALLQAKWSGMTDAMAKGNVEGAVVFFVERARDRYQRSFTKIQDRLPDIATEIRDIELIYVYETKAKYRTHRTHTIDGQDVRITYYVYFTVSNDGLWKIEKF